jgi:hypothetical protein
MSDHLYSSSEERRIREAALDETLANTFPASDPPSSIPNPDQHDVSNETSETEMPTAHRRAHRVTPKQRADRS